METVCIQVPATLYAAIFARYQEGTSEAIGSCLRQLVALGATGQPEPSSSKPVYGRPGPGTVTGRVWEIADKVLSQTGEADREAVVTACVKEGININTASTQYTYWKKAALG